MPATPPRHPRSAPRRVASPWSDVHGERTPASQRGVEIRLYGLNACLAAFAAVHANNPASARVLEKAGLACEGVQKSAVFKAGNCSI